MRLTPLLLLVACADGKGDAGTQLDGGSAGDGGSSDSGADDGGQDTDNAYWTLDAELILQEGNLQVDGSSLLLGLKLDGDLVCTETVSLSAAEAQVELPAQGVFTWWSLSWEGAALSCFDAGSSPASGAAFVGVGEMHPEVLALVERLDDSLTAASVEHLNGAYARPAGEDRTFVFGAAGLPEAWSGTSGPALSAPLPDGTWSLRAVYPFSLEIPD